MSALGDNVQRCFKEHGEQAEEIKRLNEWRKNVISAADAILAPLTMEVGRLMEDAPDHEMIIRAYGQRIKIPASKFMALYRATDHG